MELPIDIKPWFNIPYYWTSFHRDQYCCLGLFTIYSRHVDANFRCPHRYTRLAMSLSLKELLVPNNLVVLFRLLSWVSF